MKKINVVITDSSADAVADVKVREWYENILLTGGLASVATSTMFNELRVGVKLGEIEPFHFIYQGKRYNVGSDGKVNPTWPKGFVDYQSIQMLSLMSGYSRHDAEELSQSLRCV